MRSPRWYDINCELWIVTNAFEFPMAQIAKLTTDFLRLEAGDKVISHQRFFPVINAPQRCRAKPAFQCQNGPVE